MRYYAFYVINKSLIIEHGDIYDTSYYKR